jgi:hypothetical protein
MAVYPDLRIRAGFHQLNNPVTRCGIAVIAGNDLDAAGPRHDEASNFVTIVQKNIPGLCPH